MLAAVYEGKERILVREAPEPSLEDGDVLLEVEACCVCGTDLRTYRHGDAKIQPPRILGHEFCGRVIESRAPPSLGTRIGDRVVLYIVLPCGVCRYCVAGRANLCESRTTISYHHDGAFAPRMRVPAAAVRRGHLIPVGEEMPAAELALAEPLGCVAHSHRRLGIGLGDAVVVIGAGPIGVMHAVLSRLEGARCVVMLDTSPGRLELAGGFGLDAVIGVREDGSHRLAVRELLGEAGPDVVIVACSAAAAQADALELAGKGGRVEFFGGLPKSSPTAVLNTNHLHYKELVITGSYSETIEDFRTAVGLLSSGRFPSARIVTHHLPLERITEAFGLMESGQALKVCIDPGRPRC